MKAFLLIVAFLFLAGSVSAQRSTIAKGDSVVVPDAQQLLSSPHNTADILSRIPKGTTLMVENVEGHYYKVVYEGEEGYVFDNFVYPVAKYRALLERQRKAEEAEQRAKEAEQERYRQAREAALEAERQRERAIEEARLRKEAVREKGFGLYLLRQTVKVNSLGGVTPTFIVENLGNKVIKYLHFSLVPFNRVGDVVRADISGKSLFTLKGIGPVEPGEEVVSEFDNAWFGETTHCVEVRKIVVEYMDGSRFTYVNDLQHIRAAEANVRLQGECKI